jgi:hypothetical protein
MEVQDRLPCPYAVHRSAIMAARTLEHDMYHTESDLPLLATQLTTDLSYGTLAECIAGGFVRVRLSNSLSNPQLEMGPNGPTAAVMAALDQAVVDGLAVKRVERDTYYTSTETRYSEEVSYSTTQKGCAVLAAALFEQLSLFAHDVLEFIWDGANLNAWPSMSFGGPKMFRQATGAPMKDASAAYRELLELGLIAKTDSGFSYNGYIATALLRALPNPTAVTL